MVMFKPAISPIRRFVGTFFYNCKGLSSVSCSVQKSAFALSNSCFFLYVTYEEMDICLEKLKNK
jgi:hypothetical protein